MANPATPQHPRAAASRRMEKSRSRATAHSITYCRPVRAWDSGTAKTFFFFVAEATESTSARKQGSGWQRGFTEFQSARPHCGTTACVFLGGEGRRGGGVADQPVPVTSTAAPAGEEPKSLLSPLRQVDRGASCLVCSSALHAGKGCEVRPNGSMREGGLAAIQAAAGPVGFRKIFGPPPLDNVAGRTKLRAGNRSPANYARPPPPPRGGGGGGGGPVNALPLVIVEAAMAQGPWASTSLQATWRKRDQMPAFSGGAWENFGRRRAATTSASA